MGARGSDGLPVGSYYGEPTGIVGLRLFTNPAFDAEARRKWDPERFYNDPEYYQQQGSGPSVSRRHVMRLLSYRPEPDQTAGGSRKSEWENLNGTVGAQYFWFDRVFVWNADKSNFIFQLLHTYKPGTLDTSLVSSDSIVNPRTMNAIYAVTPRLMQALPVGRELLKGGQLDNKQFNDFMSLGAADPALRQAQRVHAARAQGRLRLGRRAGRAQSRLPQYRPVRRGMADALPAVRQRQADEPDQDRRRQEEFRLLAGDRAADDLHGPVPAGRRPTRPARGAAAGRARQVPHRRCRNARARQGRVRRELRTLPFRPQSHAAADRRHGGAGKRALQRPELSRLLEQVLGLDQDGRLQDTA